MNELEKIKGWGKFPNTEGVITCSPSRLILMRDDPELYEARYILKEDDTTSSMEFGTLVHMAILEPEKFEKEFLVLPARTTTNDLDGKALEALCAGNGLKVSGTKAEKLARLRAVITIEKQYDEIMSETDLTGKKYLPQKEIQKLKKIANKVRNHPYIGKHLKDATMEADGYYTHPSGVVIRFKGDARKKYKDFGLVIDIKVTKDWEQRWFDRSNFEEGRHIQGHMYCEGATNIDDFPYTRVLYVAIEPKHPHRVRGYEMDFGALEAGKAETEYYLQEYITRVKNNDWSPRKDDLLIKPTTLAEYQWEKVKEVYE